MVKVITNSLSTKDIIIYSLLAIALGLGILAVVLHFINGSGYIGPAGPKGDVGERGPPGPAGGSGPPGAAATLTPEQQTNLAKIPQIQSDIVNKIVPDITGLQNSVEQITTAGQNLSVRQDTLESSALKTTGNYKIVDSVGTLFGNVKIEPV